MLVLVSIQFFNKNIEFAHGKQLKIIENIEDLKATNEENKALKSRLEKQDELEAKKDLLEKENKELEAILKTTNKLKEELNIHSIQGTVIQRNIKTWYEKLIIYKGKNDGVKESMAVMTSTGLIGKIIEVEDNSSVVQLLNQQNQVSGIIEGSENLTGIIDDYKQTDNQLHFSKIDIDKKIKVGQQVISSGNGGVYPKGIPIGKITEVQTDNFGLTQTAYLEPSANFYDINHVIIIKPLE